MEDINKIKLAPNDLGIESLTREEAKLLDEFALSFMTACVSNPAKNSANQYVGLAVVSYKAALRMIAERRKIIE